MNFKIQQTYPNPLQGLSTYNTLVYAQRLNSLILYGQQKQPTQIPIEQPKKKIAFKVEKSAPTPLVDKISIYQLNQKKWQIIQAKGTIPPTRTDFKCVYMDPCMIIYGGKSNNKILNEVFALNCDTWTWKKLFSIDANPLSQQNIFFKITQSLAGLIASNCLWLLQIADVKWELPNPHLPGLIWQKLPISLPQNIKLCWPITSQILLLIGKKKIIKINIQTKQKISQFQFCYQKYFNSQNQFQDNQLINMFYNLFYWEINGNYQFHYCCLVFPNFVYFLKYCNHPNDSVQVLPQEYSKITTKKQIKCSTLIKSPSSQSPSHSNSKQIYCIDTKGELFSITLTIEHQQPQPNTARILRSSDRPQSIIRNNSCILQQQQNDDSSIFLPNSNSRTKIHEDYQKQNNIKQCYDNNLSSKNIKQNYNKQYKDLDNQDQNSQHISSEKIINKRVVGNVVNVHHHLNHNQQKKYNKNNEKQQQTNRTTLQINQISKDRQQSSIEYTNKKSIPLNHQTTDNNSLNRTNYQQYSYRVDKTQKNRKDEITNNKQKQIQSKQYLKFNQKNNLIYSIHQKKQQQQHQLQLKYKLQNILYNQSIKRKLLQSKIQSLQNIIIKSQKFVLQLCKYGNQNDKKKHIQKVKKIRQQIQLNWKKQIYYRKQMEGNKLPSQINQQILQTMSHIQY